MPGSSELLRYGLPAMPLAFAALPLYLLTPALYAEHFGLSLAWVGIVLMATRLSDAVADPLIGRMMDRGRTGLWRWMAWGLGLMVIFLALLLNPPVDWITTQWSAPGNAAVALLVWMGIMALGVSLANSVATLAHQSWAVAWTPNTELQSRLVGAREAWALAGVVVAAAIAAQRSGPVMGLVAIAAAAAAIVLTRSIAIHGADQKSHQRTASALPWRALFAVSEFRRLLAAFSINALANAIPATLVLFFLQDAIGATSNQASMLLAAYFLSAALGVMFWSRMASRIGILSAWRAAMLAAVIAFLWVLTLDRGDLLAFTLICLGTGFALGAELVCPPVLLGRIIDSAGHRGQLESSYFGLWNLVIKLALALSAGLALPALAILGYMPGQAVGTDSPSPGAIHWAYAGLPCVLKCIAVIALGRVRLTEAPANSSLSGEQP